jgi:hypothetical protein
MRSAPPHCVIFLQCLETEKSNEVVVGRALSAARASAPRESDKVYTSNPVLIGHYLNWPGCAASTEGGVLHQADPISLK